MGYVTEIRAAEGAAVVDTVYIDSFDIYHGSRA